MQSHRRSRARERYDVISLEVPQSSFMDVFDINGKLIFHAPCNQGLNQWSTEHWNPGMYIARIYISDELSQSVKLIKR